MPLPAADFPTPLRAVAPRDDWLEAPETIGNNVSVVDQAGVRLAGMHNSSNVHFTPSGLIEQATAQTFFFCNIMHNFFEALGFDEASGNFQARHYGSAPGAGDAVDATVYDTSFSGVATMQTPADGISPIMRMGRFSATNNHSGMDSDVVFHEFVHGVTNRLVGGRLDANALRDPQSRSMGEGWSDYFALSYQNSTRSAEKVVTGDYVTGRVGGIRSAPYDDSYPYTFGDLPQLSGVHQRGEVWCAALMMMTRKAKANLLDVVEAHAVCWQIVVDGLKLSPPNPSFLDARDAVLDALDDLRDASAISDTTHVAVRRAAWESFATSGWVSMPFHPAPSCSAFAPATFCRPTFDLHEVIMAFHIIAVEESDSTLGVYDGASLQEVTRIETGTWPHEIALNAARSTAYVTNFGIKDYDEHIGQPGASISVIDLQLFAERERLYTFTDGSDYPRRRAPHALLIDETRDQLLVNVEAEDALLRFGLGGDVPASTKRPTAFVAKASGDPGELTATPLPEGTHTMALTQDGSRLYLGCGPAGLVELDAETGAVQRSLNCGGPVRGLEWSNDGQQLLVAAGGDLCVVDPQTMLVTRRYPTDVAQLLYPTPTPDGAYVLVPGVWEGMVLRIELASGAVDRMITGSDPIHIVIPEGGDAAFVGHGRSKWIVRFDWQSFTETGRIVTRGGANGLAWAPARTLPQREVLKVGAVIPLTGPSFREGQDLRLGYEYWAERINAAGGLVAGDTACTVELLIRDSRSLLGLPHEPPTVDGENSADYLRRQARELAEAGAVALFGSYPRLPTSPYATRPMRKASRSLLPAVPPPASIPPVRATCSGSCPLPQAFSTRPSTCSPARMIRRKPRCSWPARIQRPPAMRRQRQCMRRRSSASKSSGRAMPRRPSPIASCRSSTMARSSANISTLSRCWSRMCWR